MCLTFETRGPWQVAHFMTIGLSGQNDGIENSYINFFKMLKPLYSDTIQRQNVTGVPTPVH